ncbi:MAG: hypothetical protein D6714_04080 [Bacteroidetes bacterium]|nr:MAG: hypothetical protein D6714_04080 [Bacteroidota bacterium]
MSYAVDGFAFAAESLVGKYVGAKKESETHRAIRLSFFWGMVMAVLYALAYGLAGEQLLAIFTDESAVIKASLPFLFWMILFPLASTPCYIWDGVFIGMTASVAMRNCMIFALVVFLTSYAFLKGYGNHGLWLTMILFMVSRALCQWQLFRKKGWALK